MTTTHGRPCTMEVFSLPAGEPYYIALGRILGRPWKSLWEPRKSRTTVPAKMQSCYEFGRQMRDLIGGGELEIVELYLGDGYSTYYSASDATRHDATDLVIYRVNHNR